MKSKNELNPPRLMLPLGVRQGSRPPAPPAAYDINRLVRSNRPIFGVRNTGIQRPYWAQ